MPINALHFCSIVCINHKEVPYVPCYICIASFRTACAEPRGALLLLHSDPVRSAPIVGSAASGARLLILCEQNGWCHVRTRTACGWVSKTDIVLFYCRPAL